MTTETDIEPPTAEEIKLFRVAMEKSDKTMGKPKRKYTDDEVIAALLEIDPETGLPRLSLHRTAGHFAKFFEGFKISLKEV